MPQSQLIKRVEALERELGQVKRELARTNGKKLTSEDFVGMFHGDEDFKRAMELGAEYRRSLRSDHAPVRGRKR